MMIHTQIEVRAPAAAAWTILGEAYADYSWLSSMDGSTSRERLTAFDRDAMTLSYEAIDGLPPIMERVTNSWSITPLGDGRCRIESRATIQLSGIAVLLTPPIWLATRLMVRGIFKEMAAHIEASTPSLITL